MADVSNPAIEDAIDPKDERENLRDYLYALRRDKITASAVLFLLALLAFTVGAEFLAPHKPTGLNLADRMLPPFSTGKKGLFYLLGTDELGRDLFTRLIYGARVSVSVGLLGATFSCVLRRHRRTDGRLLRRALRGPGHALCRRHAVAALASCGALRAVHSWRRVCQPDPSLRGTALDGLRTHVARAGTGGAVEDLRGGPPRPWAPRVGG